MIWLLALALAAPPTCDLELAEPPAAVSVVWLSPLGKRTSNAAKIPVHLTGDVREWLGAQRAPTVGDLLRHAGYRKRRGEPRRPWKVTVFEAPSAALCRPLGDRAPGEDVAGVPVCDGGPRPGGGCGHMVAADGGRGPDVWLASWRDLAQRGFCVLPAARFVAEGAR